MYLLIVYNIITTKIRRVLSGGKTEVDNRTPNLT